jgi:hypothetical protein
MPSPVRLTPRVRARLRSPRALQDAMRFGRLNIRELSEACGNMRYRSTIGHLHSGARTDCSPALAGRIEYVLRLPEHSLFELFVVSTHDMDTRRMKGAQAA